MDKKTLMEEAGVADATIVLASARATEKWVVEVWYRGTLRPPRDPLGDGDLPDGRIVDVKTVPTPAALFVNGGTKRPVSLAIVASRGPLVVLGAVRPEEWRWGLPPVPGRPAKACWYVLRGELHRAPSRAFFGHPMPEDLPDSDEELHADWRRRDERRRLRKKVGRPLPLPLIGVEDGPATGLAMRKGHAPGKDNYKRRRPKVRA